MKIVKNILFQILFVLLFLGCNQSSQQNVSGEKIREYANELYNRYLFKQAIDQYQFYLTNYQVDNNEQANITYRIGNIYFEKLNDYEHALAEFLKIRSLYPESKIVSEADKKIVACLERMQRPEDAQQALKEYADLEPPERESKPGKVIAKIGDREITQGDIDYEILQLPPEIRTQYLEKDKKIEFLHRFVATELMYDSAKRQGLDNDKTVIENVFQAKKSFMVQKLLEKEIGDKIKITPDDIELYYKANLEKYAEKDEDGKVIRQPALSDIQSRVTQDLMMERQQKVYQELMASYLRAENVKIFDDLVQ